MTSDSVSTMPIPVRPPPDPRRRVKVYLLISLVVLVALLIPLIFFLQGRGGGGQDVPPVGGTDEVVGGQVTWSSGAASDGVEAFAEWRGRPVDNVTTWPNRDSWEEIRDPDIYGAITASAGYPLLTVGIAMLPEEEEASFAECGTGAYNAYYEDVGRKLVELQRGDAIVRLGWEANGDWYEWGIGDDVDDYKACFRQQVGALRSTAPDVRIDWNMNKDSRMDRSVADAYPGDDVVDIIGVDFYDMYPAYPDQAAWDADYFQTQNGGPQGLGTWLQFARDHGKQLSVPEWGLNNGTGGGTDNAFYIRAMYVFFRDNAADIAYETYFNTQEDTFMILPAGINPQGSEEYRRLWAES